MEQYIIGKATVNIHGSPDHERLKEATERFLRQVVIKKKRRRTKNEQSNKPASA